MKIAAFFISMFQKIISYRAADIYSLAEVFISSEDKSFLVFANLVFMTIKVV